MTSHRSTGSHGASNNMHSIRTHARARRRAKGALSFAPQHTRRDLLIIAGPLGGFGRRRVATARASSKQARPTT
eukprot:8399656-Alexandrium_andersonii.AAC.1